MSEIQGGPGAYFSFGMFGFEELDRTLAEIQDVATQKRIIVGAMKKALKPVEVLAKSKVPVDSGDLRDSILTSTKITKRQARSVVGDRGVPRVFVGTNWPNAHLVEFGTGPRTTVATRKKVLAVDGGVFGTSVSSGSMPARPFLRPAFEALKHEVLTRFGVEMWKNIERTAKRFVKQAKTGKLSQGARRALGVN